MFNVALFPVVCLIVVGLLFLFGILFRKNDGSVVDHESEEASSELGPSMTETEDRSAHQRRQDYTHVRKETQYETRNDNSYYNNEQHERERFQRPATPVQNNHHRPVTPVYQMRPITPVGGEHRPRIASPTGVPSYRQLTDVISRIEHGTSSDFKSYNELTEEERSDVANLDRSVIFVNQTQLDSFLARINAKGDERSTRYVIVRFDKSSDGQLSASQKFIRKSFKIKNKETKLCRFARFKVAELKDGYYRLAFHDYTPYIDEHYPRFDVLKQEKAKERSRWDSITVDLHYNSVRVNVAHMLILVPAGNV